MFQEMIQLCNLKWFKLGRRFGYSWCNNPNVIQSYEPINAMRSVQYLTLTDGACLKYRSGGAQLTSSEGQQTHDTALRY